MRSSALIFIPICLLLFAGGNPVRAQALPDLPRLSLDNFIPPIRERIRKAYDEAARNPRDANAVGRLGMVLQTYEDYESAAICYERARRLAPDEFQWIYYLGACQ